MMQFLKRYNTLAYGLVITALSAYFLEATGFLRVNFDELGVNLMIFVFWWLLVSASIHYSKELRARKTTVLKVIVLLAILVLTFGSEEWLNIPDNPISFLLIVTFWIGLFYVIFPRFFDKYKYHIILVYAALSGYWLYVRLRTGSFEYYADHDRGLAIGLLLMPIPFFAILYVYEQWKWLTTLKNEKATAELALLKSQVNPHFFFNTLNNLYSLTVQGSKQAPEVILKLSDMMRYTIYEGRKDTVYIRDEVDYLNNYIALHQIRHRQQVDISFDTDFNDYAQVAPLLFIIPLENAFKHGVSTLSANAFVHMSLVASETETRFRIDNNFKPNGSKAATGIGLQNLKRRLELIHPDAHDLTITENDNIYSLILNIYYR